MVEAIEKELGGWSYAKILSPKAARNTVNSSSRRWTFFVSFSRSLHQAKNTLTATIMNNNARQLNWKMANRDAGRGRSWVMLVLRVDRRSSSAQ